MTDDEREVQIRKTFPNDLTNARADIKYLLNKLDEARAEIGRLRAGGISLGPRRQRVPFVVDEPPVEERAPPSADAMEIANQLLPMGDGDGCWDFEAIRERVARAIEQAALAAREEEREFLLGSLLRPDMDDMMAMSRAWESAGGEWSTRASVYMCAALATLARALGQRKPG